MDQKIRVQKQYKNILEKQTRQIDQKNRLENGVEKYSTKYLPKIHYKFVRQK